MADAPALRHLWAAELVAPRPDDTILEIGCGHGLASGLVASRLEAGRLVALDRSDKMIAATIRRNRALLEAGRLQALAGSFEAQEFPLGSFDTVFAVNVDVTARGGETWPSRLARILKREGKLLLVMEAPPGSSAESPAHATSELLIRYGFRTQLHRHSLSNGTLIAIEARPA